MTESHAVHDLDTGGMTKPQQLSAWGGDDLKIGRRKGDDPKTGRRKQGWSLGISALS